VPDQAAILRQYCRYSAEIKTGRNIKEMVNRALQFSMSDPKGPTYLMAAREVLEEVCLWLKFENNEESDKNLQKVDRKYLEAETLTPVVPSALPESGKKPCL
jgi:thiamine pyrophosphate-dependent acetolactate synthase large subunit-like protein